ncbi:MAG: DMT family transporter [Rhodospirillales bacterium]|jgi:drug/metabolite transporter (DMT)-like permease|nr:DMT family transporter [Rhodospirillales bacterium]MBT4040784.1 DMT family transporter [Rhodospirillales bacterium]MBT4626659.1 DMT family transporter [Rhodospirillales bacterium]MBT5352024.1 DMT family transporter [Rhodospirillales bacterium]MBT5519766.1 DMT family transporter [Rhodospirillales bacterium]
MSSSTDQAAPPSSPVRGIIFLVIAVSILSVQDVIIRFLSGDYPVHEIVFFRAFASLVPVAVIIFLEGGVAVLKTRRKGLQIVRGVFAFSAYTFFYLGIASLPLATAITIFFAAPLIVTALSVPVLKEHVGIHRWMAVLVGFAGVVLMTEPQSGTLSWGSLFSLSSAFCYSGVILTTRLMGNTESSSGMSFYTILVYIVLSAIIGLMLGDGSYLVAGQSDLDFLLRPWVMPSMQDFGLIAACGLIWGTGFYLLSHAYMTTSAVVITPFEYASLPWAVAWGYIFWQEIPTAMAVVGVSLIVGAGIYIVRREARAQKA